MFTSEQTPLGARARSRDGLDAENISSPPPVGQQGINSRAVAIIRSCPRRSDTENVLVARWIGIYRGGVHRGAGALNGDPGIDPRNRLKAA
jgi:hypothetical protein